MASDPNMNSSSDENTDWITLMQRAGFPAAGSDADQGAGFRSGMGMDWESFGFT